MRFRLKSGVDPFELNPGARAIKEFDDLTPMQFFFVCLVADVDLDNPLYSLPDKDRRVKATQIAGYGMEGTRPDKNARTLISGKVADVEAAILKHRELQPDDDKQALAAVEKQLYEARAFLEMDKQKASGGDGKVHAKLIQDSIKIAQELPKLLQVKQGLVKVIMAKDSVQLGVQTYTAADITEQEASQMEDGDEPMSTIDVFMAKKDADNGHTE